MRICGFVCVYVSVRVRVCATVCLCVRASLCASISVCDCMCICECVSVCLCVCSASTPAAVCTQQGWRSQDMVESSTAALGSAQPHLGVWLGVSLSPLNLLLLKSDVDVAGRCSPGVPRKCDVGSSSERRLLSEREPSSHARPARASASRRTGDADRARARQAPGGALRTGAPGRRRLRTRDAGQPGSAPDLLASPGVCTLQDPERSPTWNLSRWPGPTEGPAEVPGCRGQRRRGRLRGRGAAWSRFSPAALPLTEPTRRPAARGP